MEPVEIGNGKRARLPDFIHIGPPRTGTTWLHETLVGHMALPAMKETLFFEFRYDLGLKWYTDFFKDASPDLRCGEFGPSYFANAVARERIQKQIPGCKIVCTLRDPATRLYSQYRFLRRGRTVQRSVDFTGYWRSLVHWGSDLCGYATQLRRWQDAFGRDRVRVLFYDDLMSDSQTYLNQFCDFVGAPRVPLVKSPEADAKVLSVWSGARGNSISKLGANSVHWLAQHGGASLILRSKQTQIGRRVRGLFVEDYEPLSPATADEIRHMMLPETEELERMTGRDLSNWKPGAPREKPVTNETEGHPL
jgi:Sulfotransferase domain